MTSEKFHTYVKIFAKLYFDGNLFVKWKRDSANFQSAIDLEQELKALDPSLSEEEFLSVAFTVIKTSSQLALGEEPTDVSNEQIELIKDVFLNNVELIQHIFIQCSSLVNVLGDIDYEILTKRARTGKNNVQFYSALLSINTESPYRNQPESDHRLMIELTKKDIQDLIHTLEGIVEKIDRLEKEKEG